jgi:bifunctional enzyme CysN/CysC/sulfate adenylyltransferase subunit 1
MSDQRLIASDIHEYLRRHEQKALLRFVAVGSVDDGKSTLIGRLLHDTQAVYDDQLSAVKRASKQQGAEIDFSLFTDGLKAEREQGITIDVAYRYFSTDKRKFIIADTPGHLQYTRNMATGASTADLAIILIDARLGVLQQSRRHAYIAALLGIPELTVCVNKMDLVGFDPEVFRRIQEDFAALGDKLGFTGVTFIPISALAGDNVVRRSTRTPWHQGPTLLEHLETVRLPATRHDDPFRYPVQIVLRPHLDYRAFAGQVARGTVSAGDEVVVLPSGKRTRVVAIDTWEGSLARASHPMSVALRLADELDVSRGDMLVHPEHEPHVGQRIDAMLVWMSERPLDPKRSYFLKHTTRYVRAEIERVAHVVNLDTLEPEPAETLALNDIGSVTLSCLRPLYYDSYRESRTTGSFVLIDAITNDTVAAGMISGPASHAAPQADDRPSRVSAAERRERLGHAGAVIWLTAEIDLGYALERELFDLGVLAIVVELGAAAPAHTPELARRLADAGCVGIFSHAAPLSELRALVERSVGPNRFLEVSATNANEIAELAEKLDAALRSSQSRP